ncbi:uncharacterized protein PV06_04589 [Exophiala oligosperma]|uniref:Uncharacterized protein n=2 Tax=Chaetothyriales TaxID=34395 RepID=A0A0D2AUP7_9EURO|nr:uncharacterized protein PV06_04589 [Exophiala oligosperma]KAJ9638008.1 hypothetical protein H2204_004599 [Knufia peltigerae]KIW43491.1 hypothetical protein PV06_04589 [Exophiala oligosperma]
MAEEQNPRTLFDFAITDGGDGGTMLFLTMTNIRRQLSFHSALRFIEGETETVRPTLDGGRNLEAVDRMARLDFKQRVAFDGLRYATTMLMLVDEILVEMTRINLTDPFLTGDSDRLFFLFELAIHLHARGEADVNAILEYLRPEILG